MYFFNFFKWFIWLFIIWLSVGYCLLCCCCYCVSLFISLFVENCILGINKGLVKVYGKMWKNLCMMYVIEWGENYLMLLIFIWKVERLLVVFVWVDLLLFELFDGLKSREKIMEKCEGYKLVVLFCMLGSRNGFKWKKLMLKLRKWIKFMYFFVVVFC